MKYNKLVRDNIPDIIIASGKKIRTHKATNGEYQEQLYLKLIEEAMEFKNNPCEGEMADIYEVLQTLCIHHGLDDDEVKRIQFSKRETKGGFDDSIILDGVETEIKEDEQELES